MLTRLREKGLTVNGDKYQFRLPKLTFFGHKLSAQGVAPSEEKIAAVVNARPPQNVSEVRSFVQFVQYSAKFIPDFAQIAELLCRMLRKGQSFIWESEQQEAFEKLKMMMTTVEALAYLRNDCKTRIVADAGSEQCCYKYKEINGEQCCMSPRIFRMWNGARLKRRRRHLPSYGPVSVLICMCMVMSLSWKRTINHSSVYSVRPLNPRRELKGGSCDFSVTTSRLFTGQERRTSPTRCRG